jgi:hypothetical protein
MKTLKLRLSNVLAGLALLASGTAMAQDPFPYYGRTHTTLISENCLNGTARIEADFDMVAPPIDAGTYRIQTKIYRGEWVSYGLAGHKVEDAVLAGTKNSTSVVLAADLFPSFKTIDFYSPVSNLYFTVAGNGAYRATATVQKYNTLTTNWDDQYTTPLSASYGALDVPPFTPWGDMDEVSFVENLKIGANLKYSVNGLYQPVPAPLVVTTCTASPLTIKDIVGTMGNPGTTTLTVEKGILSGNNFTPVSSTVTTFYAVDAHHDINLSAAPFSINSAGALRITYKMPDDECNGVLTPVVKTTTLSVLTAAFLNDYQARTGTGVLTGTPVCGSSASSKATSSTWNITTAMPSSTVQNVFKCSLKTAIGWQGATSAGITGLSYAGAYTIDVYEVSSTTGDRLAGAPSLFLKSGTSSVPGDEVPFSTSGHSAGFDPAYPPYYVDPAFPADATGATGGYNYFGAFYNEARTNSVTVGNLTAFSARVFCVEVSQYPDGGCVVSKKSYFRIANNGVASGGNLRTGVGSDEETEEAPEYMSLDVFPNPTTGIINIPVSADDKNVQVTITDNLGKQVMKTDNLESNHGELNMETLPAGIYFYNVIKNNTSYKGKIVKH